MWYRVPLALLTAAAFVASCAGPKQPLGVRPAASAAPRTEAVALSGTVKLLAAPAISDNGAGAISDNGAGIISNNSGSIISEHGAGLKRGLLAATAPREYLLAEATITLTDAAGKPVLDAAGKPVQAVTDAKGAYKLAANLPAKNLVMHVRLHDGGALHGGELAALLARDNGASRPISTATSLGASYVLQEFVRGDQATYDKLPGAAAAKLDAAIAGALASVATAPGYQDAEQLRLADQLRTQAPTVATALADIKALLLGQVALGAGRKATEVALSQPVGLVTRPDGSLLVCESVVGRIRSIQPDGTIQTFADPVRGTVRRSFLDTLDLARAADGTLYLASYGLVLRVDPDGKVTTVAGNNQRTQGQVDVPGTSTTLLASRLAVASDGTLYIGEERGKVENTLGRVLSLGPDGILRQVNLGIPWRQGAVEGLAVGPDDTLYVAFQPYDGNPGAIYKKPPGQPAVKLYDGAPPAYDLAVAADGTLYLSGRQEHALWKYAPDGSRTAIAGTGGPADRAMITPDALAIGADGTVFASDSDNGLVYALAPDGGTKLIGGATLGSQSGTDLRNVALNQPVGAAFDAQGHLIMSEGGNRSIVRFDGHALTRLSKGGHGDSGDGGPVSEAQFGNPSGLAVHGNEIFVIDGERSRLRKVAADGTITTLVGPGGDHPGGLERGERLPAAQYGLSDGGLAVDGAGRPYFTRNNAFQVLRLADDGKVEAAVGAPPSIWGASQTSNATLLLTDVPKPGGPAADAHIFFPGGLAFDGAGNLYVTDLAGFRVFKVSGLDGPNPTITPFAGVGPAGTVANPDSLEVGKQEGIPALQAALILPVGVAADAQGNVFVTELGSQGMPATYRTTQFVDLTTLPQVPARVRKIAPDGTITTVCGPGSKLFADPAAEDGLGFPTGIAVAADGRLAIVDPGTNLVHLVPAGGY